MWLDDREPVALEELAVVGDLPVSVEEPFAFGGWQIGEGAGVDVVVDVWVVDQAGGEEDDSVGSGFRDDEPGLYPFVVESAGVAGRADRIGTSASRVPSEAATPAASPVGWRKTRRIRGSGFPED